MLDQRLSNQRLSNQRLGSALAAPPRIQAVAGAVPERHADRVVAEMLRWIVAERQQRLLALRGILGSTPDANPREQEELTNKFRRLGGPFFPLVTNRKRGRYQIRILSIDGWDRDARQPIFNSDAIPERPQLAASVIVVEGLGNRRYDINTSIALIASHHALSRLVQRSENRTVNDLLVAVTNMFVAFAIAEDCKIDGCGSGPMAARSPPSWSGTGTAVARSSPRRSWRFSSTYFPAASLVRYRALCAKAINPCPAKRNVVKLFLERVFP